MRTVAGATIDLVTLGATQWVNELAHGGIFTTDTALVIRSWNRWLEVHTGLAAQRVVGRPLLELLPSIHARGLDQHYREALCGETRILSESLHKYLIPIVRNAAAAPPEMSQSVRIGPIRSEGAVIGTVTAIDDVTERVEMERELRSQIAALDRARATAEEASRLKDEFLATLSHEIRTPLNAVLGWARMLRTQPLSGSREHGLEVIERNAGAQLRLIEDLLDTARVISGKLRLDVKPVRLEKLVKAAIEVVTPASTAKGIVITTSFAPRLPAVEGDADRLQQIVWNLLSNALKFSARKDRIAVTIVQERDHVVLSIQDTGQGISPDFLPSVFDRFRQADASSSRRHGGLGLGLSLVRQLVELHGGIVGVESAGIGKGATFRVHLPISRRAVAKDLRARTDKPVSLRGVSVLVVEDNKDGRTMLMAILRDAGAKVRAVATAAAALRVIAGKQFKPDILLSDVGLPGMDGLELIRRIRAAPTARVRQLPAIAVTAYANPDERTQALTAGYQVHLSKPIDANLLVESVDRIRVRPRSRSRKRR